MSEAHRRRCRVWRPTLQCSTQCPSLTGSEILATVNAESLLYMFLPDFVEQDDLVAATAAGVCSANPEVLGARKSCSVLAGQLVDSWSFPRLSSTLGPPRKARNDATESVLEVLTDREREIMRRVSEGLSNKEIARRLNISQGTIKVHLHHIYQKLEINNRTVLAALAISQQ